MSGLFSRCYCVVFSERLFFNLTLALHLLRALFAAVKACCCVLMGGFCVALAVTWLCYITQWEARQCLALWALIILVTVGTKQTVPVHLTELWDCDLLSIVYWSIALLSSSPNSC